jgi:hypothetical protein
MNEHVQISGILSSNAMAAAAVKNIHSYFDGWTTPKIVKGTS